MPRVLLLAFGCALGVWSGLGQTAAAATAAPEDTQRFAWASGWEAHAGPSAAGAAAITLAVDATALPGPGLVYAREYLSGPQLTTLVFPRWIPGTHAPCGPVENLGGLYLHDAQGAVVAWERDPQDPWTIHLHPNGALTHVVLDLTYIANQPSENSEGVDCESSRRYGLINWNCLLFYPVGVLPATIATTVAMRLPPLWDFASALAVGRRTDDAVWFTPVVLSEVLDRPVLCGATMEHLPLRVQGAAPGVTLDIVSQFRRAQAPISSADLHALQRLPDEADALFGGAWFSHYDVLLRIGTGGMGLEHGSCGVDGADQDGLDDPHQIWTRELMPHEFVHSWCGKHRRPIGMLTPTYQDTPVLDDLWVYEGLTELLGRVLAVRTGLMEAADWRAGLVEDVTTLTRTSGRDWRTLRDTCRCSWQLRASSQRHAELRRNQDYYTEGALFWLVVDRQLRATTHGVKSLDDFCQQFLGPHGPTAPGYTEAELVAALGAVAPGDWAGMIHTWIDTTHPLDVAAILDHSGWTMEHVPVDPHDPIAIEHVSEQDLYASIGVHFSGGYLVQLDPLGPIARLGLSNGDYLSAINGQELGQDFRVLVAALATASPEHPATIRVQHRGLPETLELSPRPLTEQVLVRDAKESDDFAPLLAARVHGARSVPAADDAPAATPAIQP